MVKDLTERRLARILLLGMVGMSLLIALLLGGYYFVVQRHDFDGVMVTLRQRALQEQQTLLKREAEAIGQDLDYRRGNAESVLRAEIQQRVDHAVSIAETIYRLNHGHQEEARIKTMVIEALRPLRFFEGRGYYFIDTLDGQCVLLPTSPQLEGSSLWNNQDPTGHYIMRGLVEATQNLQRAGFSRYYWYPPGEKTMREKIAYARTFAPFNWLIGAGEYVSNIEADQQQAALRQLRGVRFESHGYVAVLSLDGRVLVSPTRPQSEGLLVSQLNGQERRAVEAVLAQARRGGGLVRYQWHHPDSDALVEKLSYVSVYAPWNWVLVTGVYLDEFDQVMAAEQQAVDGRARNRLLVGAGITLLVLAGALVFSWRFTERMRAMVRQYQARLEQKNQELREHARKLQLAAAVFEGGSEAVVICDADNRILTVNRPFTQITGYAAEDVIGQSPSLFASGYHDAAFYQAMWLRLKQEDQWDGEIWNRRKDGSIFPEWLRIAVVRNAAGAIENYIATFSDISERKHAEEQIRHLAFYDPLTGLPNRRLLLDRLHQALLNSERHGRHAAVLFIDLDNFKSLNDTQGHDVGDLLLVEVAARLKQCVRETDTVARLGGDEFVVMLENLSVEFAQAVGEAERVATPIIQAMQAPFELAGYRHHSSCSIGVSVFFGCRESVEELLKHADTAMYQAKAAGRGVARFFVPAMQEALEARLLWESELRRGIAEGQLRLFYQVQIGPGQRVRGVEALVRWQHPERGLVPPGEFIALAEDTGLILPLGAWVLEEACRQLAVWAQSPATAHLHIAVNVSARQFHQPGFAESVHGLIQRHGIHPSRLKLELTESLLLDNVNESIATMQALRTLGIAFSMDDFGTGYSSLTYVKRLPIDQLKIDQSFVRDLTTDRDDEAIVRAIIAMAHSLKLEVIAEGVETEAQRSFLEHNGCHAFQGYLFGRPMPIEQLDSWLASTQGRVSGAPGQAG
ncbi:bifunctional diguanylate cyclase/phosphodiesterase [Rivihabitans pingtungensis]|uniref:bifunctional diguanylate cyclase/phosphodiesterase n=1 Tax=Rivihabitans pingtungensis TaxID=1054498 RepID=UPI0023569949|nr:cache domain-containing protein [Rivihabitans pingtungensis]MCK6436532.1 cache domain-containing protein [Rivihabitans pingtungensis]